MAAEALPCPFCDFADIDYQILEVHVEELHLLSTEQQRERLASESLARALQDADVPSNDGWQRHATSLSNVNGARSHDHGGEKGAAELGMQEADGMSQHGWLKCTRAGCGEYVLMADIDEHLQLHASMEEPATSDASEHSSEVRSNYTSSQPARLQKNERSHNSSSTMSMMLSIAQTFAGPYAQKTLKKRRPAGRMGRSELGPHAFEKAMPARIRDILLSQTRRVNRIGSDGRLLKMTEHINETAGLVEVIGSLSAMDRKVQKVYTCNLSVRHACKLPNEGSFCGYRNTQMLVSYLQHIGLLERTPNVLEMQDTIERAWDNDICAHARTETGGIKGTRKWIGTTEVVAFLSQSGVGIQELTFEDVGPLSAHDALLNHIEAYFMGGVSSHDIDARLQPTSLAPIYFQQPGHSLTIVGIERYVSGERCLLVFDPTFPPSAGIMRLVRGHRDAVNVGALLRPHRKGEGSLARHMEFEIITPVAR